MTRAGDLDLNYDTAIAQASGWKPRDRRWTVLRIHHAPAENQPFVADIIGETNVPGEVRRVRRESFDSVMEALAWGAFNQKSALYEQLRRKAMEWLEESASGDQKISIAERAIELLRKLVQAANEDDDDALEEALNEADDFLEGVDDARGR